MSRKDVFSNLRQLPVAEKAADESRSPKGRLRPILGSPELTEGASRTPIGAIGQSLSEVNERGRRAEAIEIRLAQGQAVVALDTADIDPSFIPDRMLGEKDSHDRLVASIRDHGQQVPILVRPHPEAPGRYQVAFGHRRLKAIQELKLPINAVVRGLSDEQLVVAQGQENNERQDLTYIEKARFANRLQERFSRDIIMSAMSLYKSDLSNMLSVVSRIPAKLIDAIGPAPSVGRRSWLELAELLSEVATRDLAITILHESDIRSLSSEDRFKALIARLKPKPVKASTEVWAREHVKLAKVTQSDKKVEIVIDRKEAAEFASFVVENLQTLFEEHLSRAKPKN